MTDEWKPVARLTLNLGLRYDLQTGIWDENHTQAEHRHWANARLAHYHGAAGRDILRSVMQDHVFLGIIDRRRPGR